MVTITLIDEPDGAQRQLFDDWAEVFAADGRHLLGADHGSWTADELRETGRSTDRPRISWAAVDEGGTVVGAAGLAMPLHDNLAMAGVDVVVHPDHRRRGVGSLLLKHTEPGGMAARCSSPRPSGRSAGATRAARSSLRRTGMPVPRPCCAAHWPCPLTGSGWTPPCPLTSRMATW